MEKAKKSLIIKRIIYLCLLIIAFVIIGFFISLFVRMSDKGVSEGYFAGKTYANIGSGYQLTMDSSKAQLFLGEESYSYKYTLRDNIIFIGDYNFLIIDSSTLYCDSLNTYFKLMGGG